MSQPYDARAYREYFENDFTYLNGFRRNVHRFADRPAISLADTGEVITYADLGRRVDALAAGLARGGVGAGDVVAYQLHNGVEFAELYLATQAAGAVGAPMNFRLAAGETAFILGSVRPSVFVYDTALDPMVAAALAASPHVPPLIVAVGDGEPVVAPAGSTVIRYRDLPEAGAAPSTPQRTVWDETTRLFTSGTTGMPKAVPMNSMIEIFSAHDVIMAFPLSPEDKTLNMTPWFHRGGLYCAGPNPTFYLGSSLVPMAAFDAEATLDLVERLGLTFLIGAPTNLAMLARAQVDRPRDLSTLKGLVTMGAPLEREAALHYQKVLNPRIFNGYGSTEGFWNTFLRPADLPDMAGTAGRSCIDDDVAVVAVRDAGLADPADLVPRDNASVGEVIVRSPKGAGQYYDNPAQDAAKFRDGWLYIGDLATWDENEFITIVGRKDDMLLSGGENVHPVQVEEALNACPGVADSLVVGVPDEQWGQLVVAYVIREDGPRGAGLEAADLDAHCLAHPMLSSFKRPRAYRFVEELPVSATGKKLHYKATEQARTDLGAGRFESVRTTEEHR
ncbi:MULTISPECIES: class I adenylate-forming enzyme family protein [Gordonia]|uniref:class I adenylate-forming enzyme family protein n=1 Tax=Gordonia TaxID=2053 RepID=UPI0032674257